MVSHVPSEAQWEALAARADLTPLQIDYLADTHDLPTALTLVVNRQVRLTTHAIEALAELATRETALARPLVMRSEIPEKVVRALYRYVGEDVRARLRTYFAIDWEPSNTAGGLTIDFAEAASDFLPTAQMISVAETFARHRLLTVPLMMRALERGKIATFIAFFARFAGMTPDAVCDSFHQACPKMAIVACRATGIQKGEFSRIYLLTSRMRGGGLVVQEDLAASLACFDKVRPEVARKMMET